MSLIDSIIAKFTIGALPEQLITSASLVNLGPPSTVLRKCSDVGRDESCAALGGRVTGAEVISELITELDASVEAAAGFEGEMQRLSGYARWAVLPMRARCHPGQLCMAFRHVRLAKHDAWPLNLLQRKPLVWH